VSGIESLVRHRFAPGNRFEYALGRGVENRTAAVDLFSEEPRDRVLPVEVARDERCVRRPRQLGQAVGEVTQSGTGRYGKHAECGYGNACACIEAVQQEHEPSDRYGWNCK